MTDWTLIRFVDDRTVRARVSPQYGELTVDFEIGVRDGHLDIDDRAEYAGFVKWDGCINFKAGEGVMAHICRVEDFDGIKLAFAEVYKMGKELMPKAIY